MLNTIARHEITLARSRVVEQVEKTVLEVFFRFDKPIFSLLELNFTLMI